MAAPRDPPPKTPNTTISFQPTGQQSPSNKASIASVKTGTSNPSDRSDDGSLRPTTAPAFQSASSTHKPTPSATPLPTTAQSQQHSHAPNPQISDLLKPKNNHPSAGQVLWAWRLELLAAIIAVGLLVAEIVILAHYDGKFLFLYWSHTWNINSAFAFLTTFMEAAIMFYVSATIGQLRWHWFRKRQHRLDWLEIMSGASRPAGAMKLLFRPGVHKQPAVIGAFIVLALLGVNTFTQQVITQVIRPYPLGFPFGGVPINTNYTWWDKGSTTQIGTQQPIPDMVAAIQNGFYSFSTNLPPGTVSPWTICNAESCDFGRYQSIAVCSACANITKDVVNPCPDGGCTGADYYTLSNANDLSLLAVNGILNVTSDTDYTASSDLSPGPLIVRLQAMVANNALKSGTGAHAVECAAYWCVQTYHGSMVNGTLSEDVVSEYTDTSIAARTQYKQTNAISLHPPECWSNDTSLSPNSSSYCSYTASPYTQNALQNFLAAPDPSLPFPAFLSGSTVFRGTGDNITFNYTSLLAGGLLSESAELQQVLDNIRYGFHQMANQITVSIRAQDTSTGIAEYSYGHGFFKEQKFHVRWGWLVYPVAMVAISLIFLLVTIWITRRDEGWKSSILPILFHSFGGHDREEFMKLDSVSKMREESRRRKVRLGQNHGGHAGFEAGQVVPKRHKSYDMVETGAGGAGSLAEILTQAQN